MCVSNNSTLFDEKYIINDDFSIKDVQYTFNSLTTS